MFDPDICHHVVAQYKDREHSMKKFKKTEASIASREEAQARGREHIPTVFPYATKNIGHIFSTELDEFRLRKMFEERDYESSKKSDKKLPPYLVDLHSGPANQSPFEWIIDGGRDYRTKEDINFEIGPIKFFFCAKHENSGKIESHLWFFKGFCNFTNPQYCQMIDAGTIPLQASISQIVRYMDEYPQTGGACGEIEVFQPSDRELGF